MKQNATITPALRYSESL